MGGLVHALSTAIWWHSLQTHSVLAVFDTQGRKQAENCGALQVILT
jgi:hypothetical protein